MTELLTPAEIAALTDCAWSRLQIKWLIEHGIPHRVDGKRILVSHKHVDQWLEGRNIVRSQGLRLEAIR